MASFSTIARRCLVYSFIILQVCLVINAARAQHSHTRWSLDATTFLLPPRLLKIEQGQTFDCGATSVPATDCRRLTDVTQLARIGYEDSAPKITAALVDLSADQKYIDARDELSDFLAQKKQEPMLQQAIDTTNRIIALIKKTNDPATQAAILQFYLKGALAYDNLKALQGQADMIPVKEWLQTPIETISNESGICVDFSTLAMEMAALGGVRKKNLYRVSLSCRGRRHEVAAIATEDRDFIVIDHYDNMFPHSISEDRHPSLPLAAYLTQENCTINNMTGYDETLYVTLQDTAVVNGAQPRYPNFMKKLPHEAQDPSNPLITAAFTLAKQAYERRTEHRLAEEEPFLCSTGTSTAMASVGLF